MSDMSSHPNPEPGQGPQPPSLAFTPVPRLADRSNGWKPEVQRAFIEALAETGSVATACRRVGRSTVGAYHLRRHPEAGEFRAAWEAALAHAVGRLVDVAMDRALYGVEVPVYVYGKLVGTRRRYNDRLLMFMLRHRAPELFADGGARGFSAIDTHRLARLKAEWRAEWEAERAAKDQVDEQETLASLDAFLENMRQNRHANMSPRARAAYEEAKRIEQEDGMAWMDAEIEAEEDAQWDQPDDLPQIPPPDA